MLKVAQLSLKNPSSSLGFFLDSSLNSSSWFFFVETSELLLVPRVVRLRSYNPSSSLLGLYLTRTSTEVVLFLGLFCKHCWATLGIESSLVGIWEPKLKLEFEIRARSLQKMKKKELKLQLGSDFKPKLLLTLKVNQRFKKNPSSNLGPICSNSGFFFFLFAFMGYARRPWAQVWVPNGTWTWALGFLFFSFLYFAFFGFVNDFCKWLCRWFYSFQFGFQEQMREAFICPSTNEIVEVNVQPSLNYFIISIFLSIIDLFFH